MNETAVSTTVAEVKAKHPFPWREQRLTTPGGVMIRMVDAANKEVSLLELVALCRIITTAQAQRDAQSPVSESAQS